MDDLGGALSERQEEIFSEVIRLLREVVGEEWVEETEITPKTSFAEDLDIESIELVALVEAIHGRYGEEVNLAGWLGEKDLDEVIDMTVGDVVRYIDGVVNAEASV